jgi:hypothetical protein
MLSAEERQTLVSRMASDTGTPLAGVLKCVAALLVLVIVAAGPWAFLTAGGPQGADAVPASLQSDQTIAESRRVFEERRNVYELARQNESPGPGNAIAGP